MLSGMAKSKKNPPEPTTPKGRSQVYNVRLGHDLDASIAAYLASQEVPPDKSAVIVAAVRDFMKARGFYPPPEQKE